MLDFYISDRLGYFGVAVIWTHISLFNSLLHNFIIAYFFLLLLQNRMGGHSVGRLSAIAVSVCLFIVVLILNAIAGPGLRKLKQKQTKKTETAI